MCNKTVQLIKKNYLFVIGLLLSSLVLWPLFHRGFFTHHDDVQVIRLYEMNKCFLDLQIPCRWVPDLGGNYGYPLFNYYGPAPYYFGEMIYRLSGDLIFSVKFMFAFSLLGSYIFMFLLGKEIWGDKGGFISGVFYSFVPYHAADLYVRGAMAEMWALMLFPAICWSVYKLYKTNKHKFLLTTSFFLALLTTSHNLSSLIFLPFIFVFVLILLVFKKEKLFFKRFLVSFLLGLLLSAFYWLPAIFESKLVHLETTTSGYFSYTEHFKGLRKLFFENDWNWGPSLREIPGGEADAKWYHVGLVHTIVWFLTLFLAFWARNRKKRIFVTLLLFSIPILVSVFMIHPRSLFVWKLFNDVLKYLQFPWRFLLIVSFFISLISGSIAKLVNKRYSRFILIVITVSVVVLNFSYFRPEQFLDVNQNDLLTGVRWDKQIKRSIFDYLPIYAKFPPAELAVAKYEVVEGELQVSNYRQGSDWISFDAKVMTSNARLRLSQYYFPGWKVLIKNKEVDIDYINELGLITFDLEQGHSKVYAKLDDSPIRKVANLTTLLTLVAIVYLVSLIIKQNKRN